MAPAEVKGGTKKGGAKSNRASKKQGEGKRGTAKDGGDGLDFGQPLQRRGLFAGSRAEACPLRNMMYGHGDARPEQIHSETVDLVEDIAIDYCANLMRRAVDQSNMRGTRGIQPEDILFLLRKDERKSHRCKELLHMNEEIKQARKQFEEDEAITKK